MNVKGWRKRDLNISTRTLHDSLEVCVEDSGPGLPDDLRLKAFEPFFSTKKRNGSHLGTGLAAAQQVAVDHDGSIELGAAPGGGCTALLVLPLSRCRNASLALHDSGELG
jgi:nitrogen fixation regulatory protein